MMRVLRPEAEEEREVFFDPGTHGDDLNQVAGNMSSSPWGDAPAAGAKPPRASEFPE